MESIIFELPVKVRTEVDVRVKDDHNPESWQPAAPPGYGTFTLLPGEVLRVVRIKKPVT